MKRIILVFTTDVWHSHTSKQLVGVFTAEKELYSELRKRKDFNAWDIEFLKDNNQTQGDSDPDDREDRDYELVIEFWDKGELNSLNID